MEELKVDDESDVSSAWDVSLHEMLVARATGFGLRGTSFSRRPKDERSEDKNEKAFPSPPFRHFDEIGSAFYEERFVERLGRLSSSDDCACEETLERLDCQLAGRQTRSTFLVVFSPDRELMASTHGDHNVYVSRMSTGECVDTLKGHPRTPWCIAFHPNHKGLLATGCLGGHVRVWDLLGGGSELWKCPGKNDVVINSLTFHPSTRLLVVATLNELHFWDWTRPVPFAKVTTATDKEKVRFVKFDPLGHQLITGISNVSRREVTGTSSRETSSYVAARQLPRMHPLMDPSQTYGRYRSAVQAIHGQERRRLRLTTTMTTTTDRGTNPIFSGLGGRTPPPPAAAMTTTTHFRDAAAETSSDVANVRGSSASQTLSDLAAAASNRLMAENAAEIAAARAAASRGSFVGPNFSHSPESSFVEIHSGQPPHAAFTQVYANPLRSSAGGAIERYRMVSARRFRRMLVGRQAVGGSTADDGLLRQQQLSNGGSLLNEWATMRRAQRERQEEPVEPTIAAAFPESLGASERNDAPRQQSSGPDDGADSAAAASAASAAASTDETAILQDHTYSNAGEEFASGSHFRNLDVALLSRHIVRLQRICRRSLAECAGNRHRRQIVRLQSIRRMLENLLRQIQSLRSASFEELSRRSREADSLETAIGDWTSSDDARRETTRRLGIRCRNRVSGGGSSGLPVGRARRVSISRASPARARLSRAHSQLVSQLRASFRGGGGGGRRGQGRAARRTRTVAASAAADSPDGLGLLAANDGKASDGGKEVKDLTKMSQRLERMLRDARNNRTTTETAAPDDEEETEEDEEQRQPSDGGAAAGSSARRWNFRCDDHVPVRPSGGGGWLHGSGRWRRFSASMHADVPPEFVVDDREDDDDPGFFDYLDFRRRSSSPADRSTPGYGGGGGGSSAGRRQMPLGSGGSPTTNDAFDWQTRRSETSPSAGWRGAPFPPPPPSRMSNYLDDVRISSERLLSNISRREEPLSIRPPPPPQPEGGNAEDAASSLTDLPPLRELIWRRLRRRNAQLNVYEQERRRTAVAAVAAAAAAEQQQQQQQQQNQPNHQAVSLRRHREFLPLMVDQMRLDQDQAASSSSPPGTERRSPERRPSQQQQQQPPPPSPPPGVNFANGQRPSAGGGGRVGQPREHHYYMQYAPSHRIQSWDFGRLELPAIRDHRSNLVVEEARIHNDASVDVSQDGCVLVTLVPSSVAATTSVGVFCLKPRPDLGRCYATCNLESSAISVSLSPTSRHLVVGLTVRTVRISLSAADDRTLMAQVFRLRLPRSADEKGRLTHRRDVHQTEHAQTSLNCIRWIPAPGQGIVYATNTGILKVLR